MTTEAPALDFQPPEGLQPVLTGLRERFEDAIREVSSTGVGAAAAGISVMCTFAPVPDSPRRRVISPFSMRS